MSVLNTRFFVVSGVISAILVVLIAAAADTDAVKWSASEGNGDFEPTPSVLEQWSALHQSEEEIPLLALEEEELESPTRTSADMLRTSPIEREDKVMKKPTYPDRIVNKPPNKSQDVSETDLFLLGAIEKLAYRMDFLEKRAQRVEDMLYQLLAGTTTTEGEPCPEGFSRQNGVCYHVSSKLLNWKSASSMCRSMGGVLLELQTEHERKQFIASLQASKETQGSDFWTGGLNPGLLWLWGTSAKPVTSNSTNTAIVGSGRCLLLAYLPPTRSYQYKGADCGARHRYVCQAEDNATERRLQRLLRNRNIQV